MRKAAALTSSVNESDSVHQRLVSFPRTSASWTAPASIATSAHEAWASMWIVEFVKKTDTGQSATPMPNAIEGHRYTRQRRMAKTSRPTIVSASRISPSRRKPAANAQWTSSALGATGGAEVVDEAGRDREREQEADADHEQRRLDEIVVEALAGTVEEDDAVRLEDRPDDPAQDRQRARATRSRAPAASGARPSLVRRPDRAGRRSPSSRTPPRVRPWQKAQVCR